MAPAAKTFPTKPERSTPAAALILCAALAILASSVARSPLTALAACAVIAVTWRFGAWVGGTLAAAVLAGVLTADPLLPRPLSPSGILAIGALLAVAVAAPTALRHAVRSASASIEGVAAGAREVRRPVVQERVELETAVEREVVQRFLCDVRDSVGGDQALLWRLSPGADEPALIATSQDGRPFAPFTINPPVNSLLHWAAQQRMPASNYETDEGLFLAAPVGDDERFHGAIGIYAADRGRLSRERAKASLVRCATRLGALLDLFEDGKVTRRHRVRAERLVSAAERIQSKQDIQTLGQAICETALQVSGATRAAFVHWNDEAGEGQLVSASSGHSVAEGLRVTGDSLVGTACRERQRFSIRDAYRMSDYPLFGAGEPSRRVGSVGVVPLLRHQRALGAIAVEGDEQAQLTAVEGELLSLLASVAAVALENVTHLAEVHERSTTDGLTGLPNRRVFDERLQHYLRGSDRYGQAVSLILIDIDHFKAVNDGYGHDAGDAVLVAVARAAAQGVRNIDLCARYGGEEFAILLPQTRLAPACEVAERLRRAVAGLRVTVGGRQISVTASFGVASYPESVHSHDALFVAADRALYSAKASGRNCVRDAPEKPSGTTR